MQTGSVLASNAGEIKRISFSEMKEQYPEEWLLVGNPGERKGLWDITSGILLHHSPDKKSFVMTVETFLSILILRLIQLYLPGSPNFLKDL